MPQEVYTVIVRGGSAPNTLLSGTNTDGIYRVDWGRVLPKKYNKFQMTANFRTKPDSNFLTASDPFVCVEASCFPKGGQYDTKSNSASNVICTAYMYLWSGTTYYHETPSNQTPILVNYPTENTVNIKLTDLTGSTLTVIGTGYANWILTMSFVPVEL